jgi:hypothetical protein
MEGTPKKTKRILTSRKSPGAKKALEATHSLVYISAAQTHSRQNQFLYWSFFTMNRVDPDQSITFQYWHKNNPLADAEFGQCFDLSGVVEDKSDYGYGTQVSNLKNHHADVKVKLDTDIWSSAKVQAYTKRLDKVQEDQKTEGTLKTTGIFIMARILSAKLVKRPSFNDKSQDTRTVVQCEIIDKSLVQYSLIIEVTKMIPNQIEGHVYVGLAKSWRPKSIPDDDTQMYPPMKLTSTDRTPFAIVNIRDTLGCGLDSLKESSAESHASDDYCQYGTYGAAKAALTAAVPTKHKVRQLYTQTCILLVSRNNTTPRTHKVRQLHPRT